MTATAEYDAIVVGLGAMGSATAFHLARRGQRVLGLDRFALGHAFGSSSGESRIIREIYFEDPFYVPIVRRAYELWEQLEREAGTRLLTITGGLMIGPANGALVAGVRRSADLHGLRCDVLSPAEVSARFPAFHIDNESVAVWDARAGYLDADECTRSHVALAERAGAQLEFDQPVTSWESDGTTVRVATPGGLFTARQLVMSAGAWIPTLMPDLTVPLTVERQVLVWLQPTENAELYDPARCPIYLWEHAPDRLAYGFPRLAKGVKAALFHDGEVVADPDTVNRGVSADEIQGVRDALGSLLPEVADGELVDSKVCLFTNTPDGFFLVDFHPAFHNVLISSPCSGHGFKFASVIGEIQADLLIDGRSRFDLGPFRLDRFRAGNRLDSER